MVIVKIPFVMMFILPTRQRGRLTAQGVYLLQLPPARGSNGI